MRMAVFIIVIGLKFVQMEIAFHQAKCFNTKAMKQQQQ